MSEQPDVPTVADLTIGGITPLTSIDFPGELATVIYLQGCPWRCGYCHNHHLLTRYGETPIAWDHALGFLRRRVGLVDAVVFSGGEPTLQRGLPGAIAAVRALGYKVGLHTAGPYPERLTPLLDQLDWVGMDIKAPFRRYDEITRVPGSGARAAASARLLIESGVRHQFRTTVHPMQLSDADREEIGDALSALGGTSPVWQPCILDNCLDETLRNPHPGPGLP